jgi:hypothetical protein
MSDVNPLKQDVSLQIRSEGGTDLLCAHVSAEKFMQQAPRLSPQQEANGQTL